MSEEIFKKKILVTIRLIIASIAIYILTTLIAVFHVELEISGSTLISITVIAPVTALVFNCFGIIQGIQEQAENKSQAIMGIIGNLIPPLFLIVALIYKVATFEGIGPSS